MPASLNPSTKSPPPQPKRSLAPPENFLLFHPPQGIEKLVFVSPFDIELRLDLAEVQAFLVFLQERENLVVHRVLSQ